MSHHDTYLVCFRNSEHHSIVEHCQSLLREQQRIRDEITDLQQKHDTVVTKNKYLQAEIAIESLQLTTVQEKSSLRLCTLRQDRAIAKEKRSRGQKTKLLEDLSKQLREKRQSQAIRAAIKESVGSYR